MNTPYGLFHNPYNSRKADLFRRYLELPGCTAAQEIFYGQVDLSRQVLPSFFG
jgi:hypothetical protein